MVGGKKLIPTLIPGGKKLIPMVLPGGKKLILMLIPAHTGREKLIPAHTWREIAHTYGPTCQQNPLSSPKLFLQLLILILPLLVVEQTSALVNTSKNSHQGHKMAHCYRCGGQRETRHLVDGYCARCTKGISKTNVGTPTTGTLTAGALEQLPLAKHEIGPNDSLSVIEEKRMRELQAEEAELHHYEEERKNDFSEESKHPARHHPVERVKESLIFSHPRNNNIKPSPITFMCSTDA